MLLLFLLEKHDTKLRDLKNTFKHFVVQNLQYKILNWYFLFRLLLVFFFLNFTFAQYLNNLRKFCIT